MRTWAGLLLAVAGCSPTSDDALRVGFFVTSQGSGNGGDLGGLEGADARCAALAEQAGLPARTWRAFLSATGPIHARDRIGEGPWLNVEGVEVAPDVDTLIERGIASVDMLDEYGEPASKTPAPGLEHDILTGSDELGMLWRTEATCADWTSNDPSDRVRVGHHDWGELPNGEWIQSWTSVHSSGCDVETMARQLGTARTYCFAAD
ncbi:MAG: hypothetical protein AAGA54_16385 [Myxococcota bacterium]